MWWLLLGGLIVGLGLVLASQPDRDPSGAAVLASGDRPTAADVQRLREQLGAAAATNPDYPIDPAQLAAVATAPQEYTPLGRIAIPDIGLDVVYAAGVQPAVLQRGPGHWPGTPLPGRPGNAVLSGHRTTWTHPFGDLDELAPGDRIEVAPEGQPAVVYRVLDTTIVPEAEYVEFVLRQPDDPATRRLTLFACHPKGDRTHRIVVRAQADPLPAVPADRAPDPVEGGE